jgi:UDP-GlcNAc:undecaprenyl-phosphate GlcNAc-1-phosphate transferase
VHKDKTPRLGSLVTVPIFFVVSIFYLYQNDTALLVKILPLYCGAFIVFSAGVVDDFCDINAYIKLVVQCIAVIIPIVFGFYFTNIGPIKLGILARPLSALWIVAMVNAFNMIDGIDMLCGSLSVLIFFTFGILFYLTGNESYVAHGGVMFILVACILAFLIYNKPKAKIFLGDGGSQFFGFMIATLPLLPAAKPYSFNIVPAMFVVTAIPFLDTIAAIWRRTRDKQSWFSADKKHIHHKLINLGFSPIAILLFILSMHIVLCLVVILVLYKVNSLSGFFILCGVFAFMTVYFTIIHYTHIAVGKKMRGKFPPAQDNIEWTGGG